ncbi:phage tail protein [Spirulina sp. CS-785/01]|uniref:phage tail protein n=1 Tax=Spirulina sp. CS-785/01 TaxID=3021716 RepID=UPI00232EF45B|nr:phage tail protein [Spirulina sp. CS-785/01]MDB9314573.1 phage tail protein [Spirulina sp. CS-785/01]
MAELNPIPTNRFYIEFDGLTEKMVASVGEMSFEGKTGGHEKPIATTKDGKTLWQSTSTGFADNPDFSLEVYLVEGDMDWYNWFKACTPKSEGGDGKWSENRKSGKLTAYNSGDEVVLEWTITNAWPKSYSLSDLASDGSELAKETYELVCEDIKRTQ